MSISSTSSRSRLPPNFAGPPSHPQDRVPPSSASSSSSYGQQQQQQASYASLPAPSSSAHFSSYTPSSGGRDRQPSASSHAASGAGAPPAPGPSASGIKPAAGGMGDDERRAIAKVYWEELGDFLVDFLKREPPNARINAREKLTRLSKQQFHELSTDVYDELVRRRGDDQEAVPYLPVKQEFHPKRNAARQKLASLTKNRFKDLASDVYYELLRRNPAFQQQQPQRQQTSREGEEELTESDLQYPRPVQNQNGSSAAADIARSRSASISSDQQRRPLQPPANNPYFPSTFPTQPPAQQAQRDRSASVTSSSHSQSRHHANGSISSVASMRGPPLQVVNDQPSAYPPTAASHARQGSYSSRPTIGSPRPASPAPSNDQSTRSQQHHPKQSVTTANFVPTKSTMALESIQVPFSRDSEYVMSDGGDAPPSPGYTDGGADASYDRTSFSSAASRARGLGMAAALGIANGTVDDRDQGGSDDLRRDYEFKIASLTGRVGTLEAELERRTRELQDERGLRERAEGDVEVVKKQLETFNSTLTKIRQELEATRAAHAHEQGRAASLEASLASATKQASSSSSNGEVDNGLRLQVKDLVTELNSLSLQNDSLQTEADKEREAVAAAEGRAREMEKKWKAAKTELRNLKATSQMFVTAPRSEDHLPASKNGALADTHVTAFQTAIDGLITAARSTAPTSTLGAMKPVILAVADISRDVQDFEARPPALRGEVDPAALADLKDRSTVTLNALTAAAKEFAMSYGLSPISLLDAAASEVAASVVGLFKLLGIRRVKKDVDYRSELAALQEAANDEPEDEQTPNNSRVVDHGGMGAYEFPPAGSRPSFSRNSSEGSNYDARDSTITAKPSPPDSPANGDRVHNQNYRLTSTSSIISSGSAFDLERKASLAETDSSSKTSQQGWGSIGGPGKPSWDSRPANGFRSPFDHTDDDNDEEEPDDELAWSQLRPYLDTQAESLISAIQTLLASVRSGSSASELRENLSSVIVIGSSIVGVSKDSLPLRAVVEGRRLLRALAGNCELLSELSEGEDMGKDVRNQIATTTFELAKNLKSLLSL